MVGRDSDADMHRALQVCPCVNEEIIPALKAHARGTWAGDQELISSAGRHHATVCMMRCVRDGTAQ